MPVFKVGDLVVGQRFIISTHLNGTEGTIIRGLEFRKTVSTPEGGWFYEVYFDGEPESWCIRPRNLKYPDDDITPEALVVYNKLMDGIKQGEACSTACMSTRTSTITCTT